VNIGLNVIKRVEH